MPRNPRMMKAGRVGDMSPIPLLPVLGHLSHDHRGSMVLGAQPLSLLLLTLLICWGGILSNCTKLSCTWVFAYEFNEVWPLRYIYDRRGREEWGKAGVCGFCTGLWTSGGGDMGAFHLGGVGGSKQVWLLEPAGCSGCFLTSQEAAALW